MDICKADKCKEAKIAFSETCWEHVDKKSEYLKDLCSKIKDGVSLRGFNFSKICLRNQSLSGANLSGANFSRADFSGADFFDANLREAELLGANISGADLTSSDLSGTDLTKANLFEARLWHANLENANLIECNLTSADLWNAKLFNVKLWRTDLTNAAFLSKKNFAFAKNKYTTLYRIDEKGLNSAEDAYRSLKRYFLASGRYNDASWASFREKNMEKQLLRRTKNIAYIPSLIMDTLCGYGEKPHRIIISSFAVIMLYATAYLLLDAIKFPASVAYEPTIGDYIYYSIITFTTVGYGDFIPKAFPFFRLLAASQAFIGTFMIGLFIFTLARKYSAR